MLTPSIRMVHLVGSVDVVVLVTLLLSRMVCPLVLVLHCVRVVIDWRVVRVHLLHNYWLGSMVCHWFWCMVSNHWFRCMVANWFWFHWLWDMVSWCCMDDIVYNWVVVD